MKKQPFCSVTIAGVSINDYGLKIPSPFVSLELANSEVTSMTSWTLTCVVGGDSSKKVNISAFEALIYSAAQSSYEYNNASGIPVNFMFGWLDSDGNVDEYTSYQGFTLKYSTSTSGRYMTYTITGYASLAVQTSMPVLRIPALTGYVQPSAVLVALAEAVKATDYYLLDVDRTDSPTYISHGAMTTSFNKYVSGDKTGKDDYDTFPGLVSLSKTYSSSKTAAGLNQNYKSLSQVVNNISYSSVSDFLTECNTDTTPQCSSYSYWVTEPTMTQPGVIHYKSNANMTTNYSNDVLQYGTSNTNILSLSGSYDGVAYNISNMNFKQLGFAVDGSGNSMLDTEQIVNSWSSSVASTYQTANIINDINAVATQFSGSFTITIPGTVTQYEIAQPISLIVISGETLSPISGTYSIITVSHKISNSFTTTLKVQRLTTTSASQTATSEHIYVAGSKSSITQSDSTSNVISPYKVDFGTLYPDFSYITST